MGTVLFFKELHVKNETVPNTVATFFATVGGLGHVPWGPGSWGSGLGLLLGVLTVRTLRQPVSPLLLIGSFVIAALLCAHAERELGRHDPPMVILDEVWAMWAIVVVLPWITISWSRLLVAFLLFRLFDITKPAPLKHLARLPSGLGIMADDLGAAVYSVLILWLLRQLIHW